MRLGLGTVQFGLEYGINNKEGKPSREKAFEILKEAYRLGIRELDTADLYGDALEVLGEFHLKHTERFKIYSKLVRENKKIKIESYLNGALKRLNLKKIDTYFFHRFQDYVEYENLQEEVVVLKSSGKISKMGVSLYNNFELQKVLSDSAIEVIQLPFNLFDCDEEKVDLLKKCKDQGKEIHIRSLFLQGLFFKEPSQLKNNLVKFSNSLIELNRIVERAQLSIEEICFAHVKNFPIDLVVMGVDNVDQLHRNIKWSESKINQNIFNDLGNIKIEDKKLLNPSTWER